MKYQVMPDLTPIEYEALKADIAKHGVLVPIEVDESGDILDGHHRMRAWGELKDEGIQIDDYARIVRSGMTEEEKRNHARRLNIHRRHLSKEQRNDLIVAMREDGMSYRQIGEAVGVSRQTVKNIADDAGVKNLTPVTGADGKQYPATMPERKPKPNAFDSLFDAWEQDEEAAPVDKPLAGVVSTFLQNGDEQSEYLEMVSWLKSIDIELAQMYEAGRINKSAAKQLADLDEPKRQAVLTELHTVTNGNGKIGGREMRKALRTVHQKERQEAPPLPSNKYRVWYADPPWQYNDSGVITETDAYGRAERHYPTMSIDELCAMGDDIKSRCENDAVLFLWVTSPLLEDAFAVIRAWGFKYKSSFVWDKVRHNFAHYNSMRHEFLLIATRGSCTPDEKKLIDSVQSIERTDKHSEKPQEFRDIIETLYTWGNKIELFSRADVDGWDTWGNEPC